MLSWSWADDSDADEFSGFVCSDENSEAWVLEAENYVRNWVLRRAERVLAHRDETGHLIAVSAFDSVVIGLPLLSPIDHPGWHLQVIAISTAHQNSRVSGEVYSGTFDAMRQLDSDRVFLTANVHRSHAASLRAAAKVGLEPWYPMDDHYWVLLGEVPE